jgi:hypothetical protein
MRGHWTAALIGFLVGVMLANRVGFLQPLSGAGK